MSVENKKGDEGLAKKMLGSIEPIRINYLKMLPDIKFYVPDISAVFNDRLMASVRESMRPLENIQRQMQGILNFQKVLSNSILASLQPSFQVWAEWGKIFGNFAEQYSFLGEANYKKFDYNWAGILEIYEKKELYEAWKNTQRITNLT